MTDNLRIVHATTDLHLRSGGTARTVIDVTDALARQPDLSVTLVSQSGRGESALPSGCETVRRIVGQSRSNLALGLGLPFHRELKRYIEAQRPALIHNHGLWAPVSHWATALGRQYRIPVVTQPHGMLEPWALNHKALKKRVALSLFQRRDLESAAVIVATSPVECENIRKLGFRQPIAVIPNGVQIAARHSPEEIEDESRSSQSTVLFLSRVHPVKGLLNLVRAWTQLAPSGWKLRIAGPDEGGHLRDVLAVVERDGMSDSVEYVGVVDGEQKIRMFRHADLFVLPTFTENFGIVVAEALSHGVPVITTRGAPWADLETYRCGWWVEIGVDPLVVALREAMAASDNVRREMGERGREYVRRFDWDTLAQQTIGVYRWVLGQGDKPACVYEA